MPDEARYPDPPHCCEHGTNTHSRLHCLAARCACTRDGYEKVQHAQDPAAPEGYQSVLLFGCEACGALVVDTQLHDDWHRQQEALQHPEENTSE